MKVKLTDDNRIIMETRPLCPKKITGTRFATVLGLNRWATPFEAWATMTKLYEEPFSENKYTHAGKTIEPKQIEWLRKKYPQIISPTDKFGEKYFRKMKGDFFPLDDIYGGMWDCVFQDGGKTLALGEMKTTGKAENLTGKNVPNSYILQCSLYAELLETDRVCLTYSLLDDSAYESPEDYEPTEDNTRSLWFVPHQLVPDLKEKMEYGREWYEEHVWYGTSPEFTEKDGKIVGEILEKYGKGDF